MILSIYSIHDSKAQAHLPPFFLARNELAIRIFSDCVNDKKHAFGQHPEDYTLFTHGHFECDDGEWFHDNPIRSLGNGVDYVVQSPQHEIKLEAVK